MKVAQDKFNAPILDSDNFVTPTEFQAYMIKNVIKSSNGKGTLDLDAYFDSISDFTQEASEQDDGGLVGLTGLILIIVVILVLAILLALASIKLIQSNKQLALERQKKQREALYQVSENQNHQAQEESKRPSEDQEQ